MDQNFKILFGQGNEKFDGFDCPNTRGIQRSEF